jgi:DNA-binding MarR family transcriptional regulator
MKTSASSYCKCLYFVSNALARKVEKLAIASWKTVNLSPSHAYLLMLVIDKPGIQPGLLSCELSLTVSTITRLLEKLEEKKLLTRMRSGRLIHIYPTPRAKELRPRLKNCLSQFYEGYSGILGKAESEKLVLNMNRIADKLEN